MHEARTQFDDTWSGLYAITGREHIRPACGDDVVDGIQVLGVIAPGTAQEVADVLRYCSSNGLALIVRGGGTKLALGNRPHKADFILSTERLNRVVEHVWADMTATVEAGCTIENFQGILRRHNQMLAADPIQPERATVGGVLATAENGTLRIRYGAIRDLVLGVEVALPDGSVIKAGGKVVKNVAGYDLTKLAIGSLGTLGVITQAVFRLHPVPVATTNYSASLTSTSDAMKVMLAILDSHLVYTGLQLRARQANQITIDARFEGLEESLHDQFVKLSSIAGVHSFAASANEVWTARPQLFANAANAVVFKCSVLPTQIGLLCDAVFRHAEMAGIPAALVAQGTGLIDVRLDAGSPRDALGVVNALRGELDRMEGTLILQRCPAEMKQEVDSWGAIKNSLPLMRRIKAKFDAAGILNPGRFVGGI